MPLGEAVAALGLGLPASSCHGINNLVEGNLVEDGTQGHSFEQVYRGNEQVPCTS